MAQSRSAELKVGLFLVISIALAAVLIIKFGNYKPGQEKGYEIDVIFPNAGGLIRDAKVVYAGIPVGSVKSISLEEGEKLNVKVRLAILKGYSIRKDAQFVVNQSGLLGDRYVDVTPGSSTAPPLKDGETVQGTTSVDLTEAIRQVRDVLAQAAGTIARVDKAIQRIDETVLSRPTLDHVSSAIANIDTASSNTVELITTTKSVVDDSRKGITDTLEQFRTAAENFKSATKRADDLLARSDKLVADNEAEVRAAVKDMAESAARLNTIITGVQQGTGTVGRLLVDPSLHDEILALVQNWRKYGLLYKEGNKPPETRGKTPVPARPAGK